MLSHAWNGVESVIEPTSSIVNPPLAVRDGRAAPVTCAACGCRLGEEGVTGTWYHFGRLGGRDAQGCLVACADLAHDRHGRVLPLD